MCKVRWVSKCTYPNSLELKPLVGSMSNRTLRVHDWSTPSYTCQCDIYIYHIHPFKDFIEARQTAYTILDGFLHAKRTHPRAQHLTNILNTLLIKLICMTKDSEGLYVYWSFLVLLSVLLDAPK